MDADDTRRAAVAVVVSFFILLSLTAGIVWFMRRALTRSHDHTQHRHRHQHHSGAEPADASSADPEAR